MTANKIMRNKNSVTRKAVSAKSVKYHEMVMIKHLDSALQSTDKRRTYMRRGSKTPAMLNSISNGHIVAATTGRVLRKILADEKRGSEAASSRATDTALTLECVREQLLKKYSDHRANTAQPSPVERTRRLSLVTALMERTSIGKRRFSVDVVVLK